MISAQKLSNAWQQLPMITCAKSVMRSAFFKEKRLMCNFCSGDFEEWSCKNYALFFFSKAGYTYIPECIKNVLSLKLLLKAHE